MFCDLSVPISARGDATKKAKGGALGHYIQINGKLESVTGSAVELKAAPGYTFVAHKDHNGIWKITESTSGMGVGVREKTKKAAVDAAESRLAGLTEGVFQAEVAKSQPTPEMLALLAAEKIGADVNDPELDTSAAADNAEDKTDEGVSLDELLADKSEFSVYDDMRAKLIKAGVPADKIAFIHDYKTPEKKMKLFKAVNAGDVRILFGSTAKMGAGTNVQSKLVALHHMDAPWRPSDLEQREGRAIRQGNEFYQEAIQAYKNPQDYDNDPKAFAVMIKRYATALTYDTRMWQIIEHKATSIEGFRRADRTTRRIEDVGGEAANAADMKAAASGDPLISREIQLRTDRKRLEMLQSAWNKNRIELQNRAAYLRDYDVRYQSAKDAAAAKIKKRDDNTEHDDKGKQIFKFTMPDGTTTDEKGVPLERLTNALENGGRGDFGVYRGFKFQFEAEKYKGKLKSLAFYSGSYAYGNRVTTFYDDDRISGVGLFERFDNWLDAFDKEEGYARQTRDKEKATLEEVNKELPKEFTKADELRNTMIEHESVRGQLMSKKKRKPVAETPEQKLERMKKTGGPQQTMMAWLPGLDPQSFRAIRNTALDAAIAAVKAGRAIGDAVTDEIEKLKTKYQGIDEADAKRDLETALSGGGGGPAGSWQEQAARVHQAEVELAATIRNVASTPTGMTKKEAREARNLATAKYRNTRRDLLNHPDYVRHTLTREKEVVRQLNALLAPAEITASPDGLLGREDRIRAALSDPEVQRVVQLDRQWEQLRGEIEKMPKRLLNAMAAELYPKRGTTIPGDMDAPSEWLQSRLGTNSPITDPEDIVTSTDRLRHTLGNLPDALREAWTGAGKLSGGVRAKLATYPNRDVISYLKDAADNKAAILSHQAANVVLHELNRAFGTPIATRNLLRENALTFAIESGNLQGLELAKLTIETSPHARGRWAKDALHAIGYAERHWDRLQPIVNLYSRMTDAEVATENASGLKVLSRSHGYVFHLQDVLQNWAHLDITGGGGGGAPSPFRQIRDLATYADAIAAGVNPKTLNAVDLLQRRIALGRKLINYRAWQEQLKDLIDPATDLPVGADVTIRIHPQDQSTRETVPAGYDLVRFAGQPYAIHKAYAGIFNALTSDSPWRQTAGWNVLMKSATTAKSMMLMFDTFHLGRLAYWNSMTRGKMLPGNPFSHTGGLTLLETTAADLRKMKENGELTEEQADQLIGQKGDLQRLLNAGLNVGGVGDNIYADWIQHLPLIGQFNRWLFEKYQRGAMAEVALIELARQTQAHPEMSPEAVARQVAKAVNIRFGNLNAQAWVSSKHAQDFMRLLFLAPQWNESLIRAEFEAAKDAGQFAGDLPKGNFRLGTMGRALAMALIGQFIANQIINYFTRGHPTWDNPEEGFGAKVSAWIPDVIGNGPGFFLNPMTLPMEISHLILKGHERTGRWDESLIEAGRSRLSSPGRFADTFVRGRNNQGESATGLGSRLGMAAMEAMPLPIGANAPMRMIGSAVTGETQEQYPGQFQRQGMQSFGIKPDSAPSAEQRVRRLAREYNQAHGIPDPGQFDTPFAALDAALKVGNLTRARAELADLLTTRTKKSIQERYDSRTNGRFTGKADRETAFMRTLTPEQRHQYDLALAERKAQQRAVDALLAR